jgi:hypothetical protein
MAIKKASNSGLLGTRYIDASAGTSKIVDVPDSPEVSSVTRIDLGAQIAFTSATTGGAVTDYTVISTPGNITATGSSSPLTITGLTNGTSYTFKARANNSTGNSTYSADSGAITAAAATWVLAVTANTTQSYSLPSGVSQLGIYAFGAGQNGSGQSGGAGGNAYSGIVNLPTPGHTATITVGASGGATSSFGSYLDSTGGGNATSKTAGNGGGAGGGGTGGNLTLSGPGQTYNYGGGGGNGGNGNGTSPNDLWDGYSAHAGGSGGNAGGSPYGGGGGGGSGQHMSFNYRNASWNYGGHGGGTGGAGNGLSGGGGGGGNGGTGGAGAAGRVIVFEKKVS